MKTFTHLEIVKHDPSTLPEDFDVVFDRKAPKGAMQVFSRLMEKVVVRLSDKCHATGTGIDATIHVRGYRVPPKIRATMQAIDAAVEDLKKNPDGVHVIRVEL